MGISTVVNKTITFFLQALDDHESDWEAAYNLLPDHMNSEDVIFHMYQDSPNGTNMVFMDVVRWIDFLAGFWEQWAEVDWIPTFDMLLLDDDPDGMGRRQFKGDVTVFTGRAES